MYDTNNSLKKKQKIYYIKLPTSFSLSSTFFYQPNIPSNSLLIFNLFFSDILFIPFTEELGESFIGNAEFGNKANWVVPFPALCHVLLLLGVLLWWLLWLLRGWAYDLYFSGKSEPLLSVLGLELDEVVWEEGNIG